MSYIDKGKIDIKGQILTNALFARTSVKQVSKITFKLEAFDNNHYQCIIFGDLADNVNGKLHIDDVIHIKGKHQINTWNDRETEEIIINNISHWPKDGLEIEELIAYMKKNIDLYEQRIEKGTEFITSEPSSEKNKNRRTKIAGMNDYIQRMILCINLLQHDCRPLIAEEKHKDPVIILLYDGYENVYRPLLPKPEKEEIPYNEDMLSEIDELPFE